MVLYFFFSRYGDHRDLHVLTLSFPTRRSSDLVERHFGGDDEVLAARHLHHDIGAQPPAIAIDNADLGLEIGMFAEAAAFEHIAKQLLESRSEEHTSELQ